MSRRRRLALARGLLVGLAVVVVAVVAGVVLQGWRSAERARLLRHQLVAERLFDSMERELTTFLGQEEARPFVEYRPVDGIIGPRPAYVVGWLQVDPEGEMSVAHPIDEGGEARLRAVADGLDGWGSEAVEARTSTVTVRVPVVVPAPKPVERVAKVDEPQGKPSKKNPQETLEQWANKSGKNVDNIDPNQLPVEVALNNAALPRANRQVQTQQVSRKQLVDFAVQQKAEPVQQAAEPVQQAVQPPREAAPAEAPDPLANADASPAPSPPGPRKVWVPVQVEVPEPAPAEVVDVVVSPIVLEPGVEDGTLVLRRTVRLDKRTWAQALVVDIAGLQAHLVARSLGGSGLEDALEVRWGEAVDLDDGSTDETARRAAEAGAVVLRHVINRGQGAALQTGIAWALARGAEYVVTFDADGQHEPGDLPHLLAPLLRGEADFALGSRFLAGRPVEVPRLRRWVLRAGIGFTWLASGMRLTDAHNGLRAFSRRAALALDLRLDRMAHASELIDQIRSSGLGCVEVPVRVRYTDYSRSKGQGSANALRIAADYLLGRILS